MLRYDLLPLNKYQDYRWRTHAVSAGLRGVLPLMQRFALFAEADLGLALANRTRPYEGGPTIVSFGQQGEKEYSEELAPYVRVAGGIVLGEGMIGAALGVTYVHTKPISDFGAVHNDGGPGFSLALRLRGF